MVGRFLLCCCEYRGGSVSVTAAPMCTHTQEENQHSPKCQVRGLEF